MIGLLAHLLPMMQHAANAICAQCSAEAKQPAHLFLIYPISYDLLISIPIILFRRVNLFYLKLSVACFLAVSLCRVKQRGK